MRILIALLVLALTAADSLAQMSATPGGGQSGGYREPFAHRNQEPSKTEPPPKLKADEKAYNSALKAIPDKPYDPWQGTR